MYEYRVHNIVRVVDGDTVDTRLDLGFGLSATIRVRVADIDTPELYGPTANVEPARKARDFTTNWLDDRAVTVRTFKGAASAVGIGDGAFGRWLGDFRDANTGDSLTDALHAAGHHT